MFILNKNFSASVYSTILLFDLIRIQLGSKLEESEAACPAGKTMETSQATLHPVFISLKTFFSNFLTFAFSMVGAGTFY